MRKIVYFILIAFLFVSIFTFKKSNNLEADIGTWSNYRASSYAGGDGSSYSPYLISSAEELALLSYESYNSPSTSLDCCYKLISDIDLSAHYFVPIGRNGYFTGVFDGQGHKIIGFQISPSFVQNAGLFSSVRDAEICRITFIDVNLNLRSTGYGALLSCYVTNSIIHDILALSGELTFNIVNSGGMIVGGVIGQVEGGNCYNIYNRINLTITSNSTRRVGNAVGGIISGIGGAFSCYNMIFTGNISYTNTGVKDYSYIGGILGINNSAYSGSIMKNVFAVSNINILNTDDFSNGLIGYYRNILHYSYYIGNKSSLLHINTNDGISSGAYYDTSYCNTNLSYIPSGWDTSVWGISSYINSGRPYLKWLYHQNNT